MRTNGTLNSDYYRNEEDGLWYFSWWTEDHSNGATQGPYGSWEYAKEARDRFVGSFGRSTGFNTNTRRDANRIAAIKLPLSERICLWLTEHFPQIGAENAAR